MKQKIQTFTGKVFDFVNPTEDMIDIQDIAHALSNICRFTGHTTEFYSVARHSVLASRMVPQELSLQALLHDATEAYMGDLNKPLKCLCPDFIEIEDRIWVVIATKFGVPIEMDPLVKQADIQLLHAESLKFLGPCEDPHLWDIIRCNCNRALISSSPYVDSEYYVNELVYWKNKFLKRYESLTTIL